jgi:hypothetical protein
VEGSCSDHDPWVIVQFQPGATCFRRRGTITRDECAASTCRPSCCSAKETGHGPMCHSSMSGIGLSSRLVETPAIGLDCRLRPRGSRGKCLPCALAAARLDVRSSWAPCF